MRGVSNDVAHCTGDHSSPINNRLGAAALIADHCLTRISCFGSLPTMTKERPLRIGISRCLLGDQVRYDGGHKRDPFLADVLSQHVEWVSVCPEVEVGLGTPREPIRLRGFAESPRLVTITTRADHTSAMIRFSERCVIELEALDLSGYVFKEGSPSCGVNGVRVYPRHGRSTLTGTGLFARAFMKHFPLMPVQEEGRLHDPATREHFFERVFSFRRWQDLVTKTETRKAVRDFHAQHTCLLLAHSPKHYESLDRLVRNAMRHTPADLVRRYGTHFMKALEVPATGSQHITVLYRITAHFENRLTSLEKQDLHRTIEAYRRGRTSLLVPLTLLKHHVHVLDIPHLQNQTYLNPSPQELMLRNL